MPIIVQVGRETPPEHMYRPLLLDAGNLAIYYSKGRNQPEADLFYTQVKYLRRVKKGSKGSAPLGLVIPTQEKNLCIKVDEERLRSIKKMLVS